MFLNKMNQRLTDVGRKATTRFLRRFVSGPIGETKDKVDPDDGEQQKELWLRARTILVCTPKVTDLLAQIVDPKHPDWAPVVAAIIRRRGCLPTFYDPRDSWDQAAMGIRAFNAIKALLAKHEKSVKDLTFAIQGFENVGSWIALLVHEAGGKVVAVSDPTVAVKNKEGIDITALLKRMNSKRNHLDDFSGADWMEADELLTSECDVLIPVARPLSRKIAADVKARFVVKNVNYPTHPTSDEILSEKGVVILDKSGIPAEDLSDHELLEIYLENAFDRVIKGLKASENKL